MRVVNIKVAVERRDLFWDFDFKMSLLVLQKMSLCGRNVQIMIIIIMIAPITLAAILLKSSPCRDLS